MRFLPIVLLIATACLPSSSDLADSGRKGTAVGNPGNMDFAISAYPDGVQLDRVDVLVDRIVLEDCVAGAESVVELQAAFDALGPSSTLAAIPTGDWCFTTIELWKGAVEEILDQPSVQGEVILGGVTDLGTTFQIGVNIGDIEIADRYYVDDTQLLVGLNLDVFDLVADAINAMSGTNIEIDAGEYDTGAGGGWGIYGSPEVGLWLDSDEDGAISSDIDERNEGDGFVNGPDSADADPAAMAADKGAAGCGCATQAGQSGWFALLFLPLIWRRRQ